MQSVEQAQQITWHLTGNVSTRPPTQLMNHTLWAQNPMMWIWSASQVILMCHWEPFIFKRKIAMVADMLYKVPSWSSSLGEYHWGVVSGRPHLAGERLKLEGHGANWPWHLHFSPLPLWLSSSFSTLNQRRWAQSVRGEKSTQAGNNHFSHRICYWESWEASAEVSLWNRSLKRKPYIFP